MDLDQSLQDQFAPNLICFGCGPANDQGLKIKSFVEGNSVVARFNPQKHHQAFEGMINGGIIGALLDCHMNWTAAWQLMQSNGLDTPPCTVTGEYKVQFKAPTTANSELTLNAWVVESTERKAVIEAKLVVDGKTTALGFGTFIAVREGHPAYHRW